ncbi:hypothetical protein Q7P37_009605 [Cladosporium fusiforme]
MTSSNAATYPRANTLLDGSILGAVATTIDSTKILQLVVSQDQGQTWSPKGSAASRPASTSDLDNPFPLQLSNGNILLAFRNHDKSEEGDYTYYRITLTTSSDNGATWTYLSTPASEPAGPNGIWEPFLRNGQDGSLQLYYSRLNGDDDQNSILRTSTDGGVTWSDEQIISGVGITARDGMLGVAAFPDPDGQELVAVFESLPVDGTFSVHAISSPDDGKSWGDRRLVYSAKGERNNAGAPQVVNVGGKLCVSFMTDEDTQLHEWVKGAGAKLLVSSDGVNFEEKTEVFAPDAVWPGMVALNESALLYTADRGGAKSQVVRLE